MFDLFVKHFETSTRHRRYGPQRDRGLEWAKSAWRSWKLWLYEILVEIMVVNISFLCSDWRFSLQMANIKSAILHFCPSQGQRKAGLLVESRQCNKEGCSAIYGSLSSAFKGQIEELGNLFCALIDDNYFDVKIQVKVISLGQTVQVAIWHVFIKHSQIVRNVVIVSMVLRQSCLCLFVGQVMSPQRPHHSDQMFQGSKVSFVKIVTPPPPQQTYRWKRNSSHHLELRMKHLIRRGHDEKLWSALWRHVWFSLSYQFQLQWEIKVSHVKVSQSFLPRQLMASYERLEGDEDGVGRGGGGSLKRNVLVVLLALALFVTILGRHLSTPQYHNSHSGSLLWYHCMLLDSISSIK